MGYHRNQQNFSEHVFSNASFILSALAFTKLLLRAKPLQTSWNYPEITVPGFDVFYHVDSGLSYLPYNVNLFGRHHLRGGWTIS